MIAFLSQHIETGVRGFASILLTVFPFLPASIETNPEQIMIIVGFAGQGLAINRGAAACAGFYGGDQHIVHRRNLTRANHARRGGRDALIKYRAGFGDGSVNNVGKCLKPAIGKMRIGSSQFQEIDLETAQRD